MKKNCLRTTVFNDIRSCETRVKPISAYFFIGSLCWVLLWAWLWQIDQGRPIIDKNLLHSDSVRYIARAGSVRHFHLYIFVAKMTQNDRFCWILEGKLKIFSYALTRRWTALKIYMWPLLDALSLLLFACLTFYIRRPQNLKCNFGAQVWPGSALRSIFCSICAQFATSRADCNSGIETQVWNRFLSIPGRFVRAGPIRAPFPVDFDDFWWKSLP